jgi:hypothetical protein
MSCVCCQLELRKLEATKSKLNTFADIKKCYMIPAVLRFQFHMIAQIDNAWNITEKDIQVHPKFTLFALSVIFDGPKMYLMNKVHQIRS